MIDPRAVRDFLQPGRLHAVILATANVGGSGLLTAEILDINDGTSLREVHLFFYPRQGMNLATMNKKSDPNSGSSSECGEIPVPAGGLGASSSSTCADALILAALSGQLSQWPEEPAAPDHAHLYERIDFHGVSGLLAEALKSVSGVPETVQAKLRGKQLHYLFWEDRHRKFVGGAISALTDAGIATVIFKGTACAYSVYGSPSQRVRGDTDILVAPKDRGRAAEVLASLGFERGLSFARERGVSQISYELAEPLGWSHAIDLHWQINNSAFLSQLFSWGELNARSVPLTAFHEAARSPRPVDAILISCFHRLVHLGSPYTVDGTDYYSADRLIWLADIDLLSKLLNEADWEELFAHAREKGLLGACLSGLSAAQAAFGTALPKVVLGELAKPGEVSAVDSYLYGKPLARFRRDVAAQSSVWGKVAYIGEHVFPPVEYMRAQFGGGWLPALYLDRGIRGIAKRFTRRDQS